MSVSESFQGVACSCLDDKTTLEETLFKILDLTNRSVHHSVQCYDLSLANKYYRATIQLLDSAKILEIDTDDDILKHCHAVIIYGNGQKLSVDTLDREVTRLKNVGGEPRILLCNGIDEECSSYKTLQDWCITNGYELILVSEDKIRERLIDSLSAYRWAYRLDSEAIINSETLDVKSIHSDESNADESAVCGSNGIDSNRNQNDDRQLNDELMKKLMDFDSLLNKLSTYRDNPEIRGNPEDKNIEEIAEILSGLLGDDVDNFLSDAACEASTTKHQSLSRD